MIIDLNYRVDILKGIVSQNAEHPLYYDDQNAHRVNVSLYRGQEEIDLSGLSCNGYVVFVKEGASIGPLTGEVSNNTCSVVLPHEAYQHPGAIRVEIKLIEGDSVTTVLMLTGHVSSGRGDRVIDITGSIVPSLDSLKATIEELESRIAAIEVSDIVELERKVVRHDTAQSLTDAQKAQARENIGASNADVTDLLAEPIEYWDTDRTVTLSGRSLTRTGGYTYTMNGTASGNLYYRLSDVLSVISTTSGMNNWTSSIQFEENVPYTLTVVPVSGRLIRGDSFYFRVTAEDNTLVRSLSVTDAAESATFYWPDSTKKGKLVLRVSTDTVTENFVFRVYLTRCIYPDRNIAETEASVSRIGYGVGSLLTMGGTLYKATQAIAPGTVITPGTNVTETTVAEQLAERDTAIAAEATARAAFDTASGFMNPFGNLLWPVQTASGSATYYGRTIKIDRNRVEYVYSSSGSSNWRCVPMTGTNVRIVDVNGSTGAPTQSTMKDADFVTLPKCFDTAFANNLYFWVYAPDNPGILTSENTGLFVATKPAEGDKTVSGKFALSALGGSGSAAKGLLYAKMTEWPTTFGNMASNGNAAFYLFTKSSASNAVGVFYWGFGYTPIAFPT